MGKGNLEKFALGVKADVEVHFLLLFQVNAAIAYLPGLVAGKGNLGGFTLRFSVSSAPPVLLFGTGSLACIFGSLFPRNIYRRLLESRDLQDFPHYRIREIRAFASRKLSIFSFCDPQ